MTTVSFKTKDPIKVEDLMYVPFGEVISMLQTGYKIENIENIFNINVNQTVKQKLVEVDAEKDEKTPKAEPKKQKKTKKTEPKPKNTEKKSQPKKLKTNKSKTINIF